MPNFLDVAAGVVTVPKDGYGTETALNVGPGSLYYKAGSTVSSGSNDGTLTSGSSLSLTGPTSFVAVSQGARLVVSDPQFDEAASLAASVGQPGGVAVFSDRVVAGGTADDTATVQAALTAARTAGGGTVRGVPGTTYKISAPLVIGSSTTLDMTGCTVQFASTSIKTNMLQNATVAPAATAADVATTAGSAVVTSATLAAVAQAGQVLAVVGAGPQGGDTASGPNNIWLYGTVASVVGNNITLTSSNKNGIAANSTGTAQTGYLFNRDSNITVRGGTWDGGTNWNVLADRTSAGFNSHQLRFRRVDGLTIERVTVKLSGFPQGGGWVFGVALADCTDVYGSDITGAGSSTTVQGDGPLRRVLLRNMRGQTQDDMVAFGAVSFQGTDTEGDITDVVVDGIEANGSWTAFKAFAGTGSNGAQRYVSALVRSAKGTTVNAPIPLIDYAGAGSGPTQVGFEDITVVGSTTGPGFSLTGTFARAKLPTVPYAPDQAGFALSAFDPADAAATLAVGSGFIYLTAIWCPYPVLMTNLVLPVKTGGATLTAGQSLAGVYDPQGNLGTAGGLVAKTADQSANWTSAGPKSMALTAQSTYSLALAGGPGVFYWLAVLSVGTTPPTLTAKTSNVGAQIGRGVPYTASPPSAKHRAGYESAGGRTSLVSLNGLTISDNNLTAVPFAAIT